MTWESRLQAARRQHLAGQLHAAEPVYREILRERPQQPEALFLLGSLALQRGEHAPAAELLEQAARLDPTNADACNNYGLALFHLGRLAEATVQYERALRRRPDFAEALSNLGLCRYRQKLLAEAAVALERAVALKPDYADAHNNLGIVRQDQGRLDDAIASIRRALALNPDYAEAHSNLARALRHRGDPESAIEHARRALALDSALVKTYGVLGNCHLDEGDIGAAFEILRQGLARAPEDAELNWNLSVAELLGGCFPHAWQRYEWRFRSNPELARPFRQPRWDGAVHPGKRLLVHAEQGLGDTIQFARYLPLVKARTGDAMEIVFECQRPLARLLRGLPGADRLVVREDDARVAAPFDLHIPLLSLPALFGTTLDTIPALSPLATDSDEARQWTARLDKLSGFKIGLVWAGNPDHKGDRQRSMALSQLAPLAGLDGVRFLSLQKGRETEIRDRGASLNLIELGSQLTDFAATAAAVINLDLVISVDTAVAHLAATLGKPAWILLPFSPDWRWLLGRADSPWYPGVRLFRQPRRGDWESVVRAVAQALAALPKKTTVNESSAVFAPAAQQTQPPCIDTDAETDRALKRHRAGDLTGAEAIYRAVLNRSPAHAQALYLLGTLTAQRGRWAEAAELLAHAAAARPHHPDTHGNLAIALQNLGRLDDAVAHFRRAVALYPEFADGHNNLGVALQAQGLHDEAERCFREALRLRPDYPEALNNLGNAYERRHDWERAAECYRGALRVRPGDRLAAGHLGVALRHLGRIEEAILHGRQSLAGRPPPDAATAASLSPAEATLHKNLSQTLLAAGLLSEGWRHYELRFAANPELDRRFRAPRWDGKAHPDRRLLVHAEQGLGDTIQFARYLPRVKACAGTDMEVLFECQPELTRLLRGIGGVDRLLAREPDLRVHEPFDWHIPLLSLPALFDTVLETIPTAVPYLTPDPEEARRWSARLGTAPGCRVGLAWAGNPAHRHDRQRSLDASLFLPLMRTEGIRWVSLQKGRAADAETLGAHGALLDLGGELHDFAATAAVVANLDLVISVDTAVAHLAGALGKPVWLLTPFAPDWRWLLGRADSPWYPSMRLFRQPRPGDWQSAMEEVFTEMTRFARAGARP